MCFAPIPWLPLCSFIPCLMKITINHIIRFKHHSRKYLCGLNILLEALLLQFFSSLYLTGILKFLNYYSNYILYIEMSIWIKLLVNHFLGRGPVKDVKINWMNIMQLHMISILHEILFPFKDMLASLVRTAKQNYSEIIFILQSFNLSSHSLCLNFFHLLAQKPNIEKISIDSNKFFHNFHLSESSFTCHGLRASGLAWRLQSNCVDIKKIVLYICTITDYKSFVVMSQCKVLIDWCLTPTLLVFQLYHGV